LLREGLDMPEGFFLWLFWYADKEGFLRFGADRLIQTHGRRRT